MLRRIMGIVAAAGLVVPVAGCGFEDGGWRAAPGEATATAAGAPAEVASSEAAGGYEPLVFGNFVPTLTDAFGAESSVRVAGKLLDGSAVGVEMRLATDDDEGAVRVTTAGEYANEVTYVDGSGYLQFPGEDVYYLVPQEMLEEDLGDALELTPEAQLADLGLAINAVLYEGPETRRGERLHRYAVSVGAWYYAQEFGIEEWEVPPVAYRVWVDDANLLQRIRLKFRGVPGAVDFTYSDWSAPVRIESPPAELVAPLPEWEDVA
ncbi:hypothetical protein [Nocardioides sp. YIM 152588]|uniref:hypothetical protein n=1 Tax=Nocardioides sp. YIM 152588 TaxID=3158259 RepID=UPI0032E3A6C3